MKNEINYTELRKQFNLLEKFIAENFINGEEMVMPLIIGSIIGVNILYISPPGAGKTSMIKMYAKSIGNKLFSIMLAAESSKEDLFGTYDFDKLMNGEEKRIPGGIRTANIVYLDEIDKASPGILAELLEVTEKKEYTELGIRENLDIATFIASVNILPNKTSPILSRFPIRYFIKELNFDEILRLQKNIKSNKNDITIQIDNLIQLQNYLKTNQTEYLKGIDEEDLKIALLKLNSSNLLLNGRKIQRWFEVATAIMWYQNEQLISNSILAEAGLLVLWDDLEEKETVFSIMKILMNENQRLWHLSKRDFCLATEDLNRFSRGELDSTALPAIQSTFEEITKTCNKISETYPSAVNLANKSLIKAKYLSLSTGFNVKV